MIPPKTSIGHILWPNYPIMDQICPYLTHKELFPYQHNSSLHMSSKIVLYDNCPIWGVWQGQVWGYNFFVLPPTSTCLQQAFYYGHMACLMYCEGWILTHSCSWFFLRLSWKLAFCQTVSWYRPKSLILLKKCICFSLLNIMEHFKLWHFHSVKILCPVSKFYGHIFQRWNI